jgi:hypothetical protein
MRCYDRNKINIIRKNITQQLPPKTIEEKQKFINNQTNPQE